MRSAGGKVVLFILLFAIAGALYFSYQQVSLGGTDDSIQFIRAHINGRGEIDDLQEEIFAHDAPHDIAWFDDGKNVEIRYGKVKLKYKRDEIMSQENVDQLLSVFIEFRQDKDTGTLTMFYRGTKIEKSVKL